MGETMCGVLFMFVSYFCGLKRWYLILSNTWLDVIQIPLVNCGWIAAWGLREDNPSTCHEVGEVRFIITLRRRLTSIVNGRDPAWDALGCLFVCLSVCLCLCAWVLHVFYRCHLTFCWTLHGLICRGWTCSAHSSIGPRVPSVASASRYSQTSVP